MLKGTSC